MTQRAPETRTVTSEASHFVWSSRARLAASAILLMHVLAMVAGPWSTPPASDLARAFAGVFRPYLDATFLNNGYNFFAPEPGPSHLIRYEMEMPDGSTLPGKCEFPSLADEQPRLRYHRHFMLTETMNMLYESYQSRREELTVELGDKAKVDERLAADNHPFPKYVRSYGEHLLAAHGGTRVKLILRRHELPSPWEVLRGAKLTDATSYAERELDTIELPAGQGGAP